MTNQRKAQRLTRIVSGGQTGVDRGALEAAILLGISHGGWCPLGRRAEDGPIPPRYKLEETESANYAVRTRQNVVDSDGTLVLCRGPLQGGTELTYRLARHYSRPCLLVDLQSDPDLAEVRQWLTDNLIEVLNVAGPRESSHPGIADDTCRFVQRILQDW